ncbi:MAG: response regulator [Akkermansiaceae bacterium]|nr:response regulator [Armatimonadota bacterium]
MAVHTNTNGGFAAPVQAVKPPSSQNGLSVGPVTEKGKAWAKEEFGRTRIKNYERTDRMFAWLLGVEWIAAILAAVFISPRTWDGLQSSQHPHVTLAVLLGFAIIAVPIALVFLQPGKQITRHAVAVGQMLMSGLLIHVTGGRLETHFHVFGSLAFMAFYRDWRVLITASAVTAVDHVLRGFFMPQSIYGTGVVEATRSFEHAGWVVFEVVFLSLAAAQSAREMRDIADRQSAMLEARDDAQKATSQAESSAERFQSLSSSSPVGVMHADATGAWLYANPRWSGISGMTEEASLGNGWLGAIHEGERAETSRAWSDAVRQGSAFAPREMRVARQDGLLLWVRLQATPLKNADGSLMGYVGTAEDVTERRQWLDALHKDKEMAEEANRSKSQFLANMSHELRTPLNAIIGFSEILQDKTFGPLANKQERYVTNILNGGRHLLVLINNILDLAKIEAGRMELDYETFAPSKVLQEVTDITRPLASQKSIMLTLNAPLMMPLLTADLAKFKQVLLNLLSNAIKFTPEGGRVTLTVSVGPDTDTLNISVSDTGIGIAPEDQERIFGEFEQVDSSYSRQQQGTGLGLALTRQFIRMHGGDIHVQSGGEGSGSTFVVIMPMVPPVGTIVSETAPVEVIDISTTRTATISPANSELVYAASSLTQQVTSEGSEPLILVVEDDPSSAELIEHYLVSEGYRVVIAGDGEEAIAKAQQLLPSAITLDVLLPGMDGWEVLSELKQKTSTSRIPVIMISITPDKVLAEQLGAIECLTKPVDRDRLTNTLAMLQPDNSNRVSVLVIDDDPRTLEMVADILNLRGFRALVAKGGREGIETAILQRPDLIVLDLMMPEVSGFEVVRALQDHSEARRIPVVVYTANEVNNEARQKLAQQQVRAIVSKRGKADLLRELEQIAVRERESIAVDERGTGAESIATRESLVGAR